MNNNNPSSRVWAARRARIAAWKAAGRPKSPNHWQETFTTRDGKVYASDKSGCVERIE